MNRRTQLTLLVAAAVLAGAGAALANIGPPVDVRLLGKPRAAVAGEPFAGELELVAGVAGRLADFRLEGARWTGVSLDAPAPFDALKSQNVRVRFTAVPADPDQPLDFVFEFGGETVRKSLDLSARSLSRATQLQPVRQDLTRRTPDRVARDWLDAQAEPAAPAAGEKAYNITVHGRWCFDRSDAVTLGADSYRIQVWDQNPGGSPIQLAETYTNSQGYYSATFSWGLAGYPDLYVSFASTCTRVDTKDATWHSVYGWSTGVTANYTGTNLDFGWLWPADDTMFPGLLIHTDIARTYRWLNVNRGYATPKVDVYWPDGTGGSWWWSNIIHIGAGSQWQESVHTHEYGHHWMSAFGIIPSFNYCNGWCDASPTDCGHCLWCQESGAIAWLEGFPDWMGDYIPRTYAADYGTATQHAYNFENLSMCTSSYGDPLLTEGHMAALLHDMVDSDQDTHNVYGASYSDALALGTAEIFAVADLDAPLSASAFITAFKARYPGVRENFWETAKNCGYETDLSVPPAVSGLISSHATTGDSPDPTIDYWWTRPYDDASGIDGYAILVAHSPSLPTAVKNIGDVTTYTTASLAPGVWYFCIRPVDRAGRWNASYASYGPVTVRAAEPANLAPYLAAGWSHEAVPRSAADATGTSVPEPAMLTGAGNTYWNMFGRNIGESTTSIGFTCRLFVDNVFASGASWGTVAAGVAYMATNWGPVTVKGGRHTFEARHDALDQISETNESDNFWAHQWIWSPYGLTANVAATSTAPPLRTAGWTSIVDGSLKEYNTDGFRFASSGWWNVVTVRPLTVTDDYDARLFTASTGATDGFTSPLASSAYGAGYLDAVIVNRNLVGNLYWDFGAINYSGGAGQYEVLQTTSSGMSIGDSLTVPLALNQTVAIREFNVTAADTGWFTLSVSGAAADGPLQARWFNSSFQRGALSGASSYAASDANGLARMIVHITTTGYHGVLAARNPRDGLAARSIVIEVEKTHPDFLAYQAAGWHSPLVPRPANDGTGSVVALPDTLYGNVASTYLNVAVRNDSPVGAPSLGAKMYFDGVYSWWLAYGAFGPYSTSLFNWGTAWTMGGGRHTLSMRLDDLLQIEETDEANNIFGEQYVWSPQVLTIGTPATRPAPPERTGGWTDNHTGESLWFDCDGLRLPAGGGYWRAVAVAPGDTSDVDVRLHEVAGGTKNGFAANLGLSAWPRGLTDYVLINFNVASPRAFDVGVLRPVGAQPYTVDAEVSLTMAITDDYTGPSTVMGANHLLDVREFYLTAGQWAVRLDNLAGTVNWGLTVHPADVAYQTKSTALAGGLAYSRGDGLGEWVTVTTPAAGWYGVAVWKAGASDVAKSGTYRLRLKSGVTAVAGETPPAATALTGIHPNPFNPQTRIAFDLSTARRARLEIFDLHGARVRTLVNAELPAGRHEAVWDGRNEAGRTVASGTYVARLVAGEVSQLRKMTLVK